MDIRDLAGKPLTECNPTKYLEKIFELQRELLKGYIGIEGLPPYPVDVNTKTNQVMLKDFNARATEELAEAWEYIEDLWGTNKFPDQQAVTKLYGFNEELGDVLHFLIELYIYSDISAEDINKFVAKNLGDNYNEAEGALASFFRTYQEDIRITPMVDSVPERFLAGGNILYVDNDAEHAQIRTHQPILASMLKAGTWDVVYELNLARNTLKNKPWKQTGMLTDINKYKKHLLGSFWEFLVLMAALGLDQHMIYEIYDKKNKCNIFRQNSKY